MFNKTSKRFITIIRLFTRDANDVLIGVKDMTFGTYGYDQIDAMLNCEDYVRKYVHGYGACVLSIGVNRDGMFLNQKCQFRIEQATVVI